MSKAIKFANSLKQQSLSQLPSRQIKDQGVLGRFRQQTEMMTDADEVLLVNDPTLTVLCQPETHLNTHLYHLHLDTNCAETIIIYK